MTSKPGDAGRVFTDHRMRAVPLRCHSSCYKCSGCGRRLIRVGGSPEKVIDYDRRGRRGRWVHIYEEDDG